MSIIGAIVLFIEVTEGYMMQSDIDSFVESSGIHVQSYLDTKDKPDGLYERLNNTHELVFYSHKLALVDNSEIAGDNCPDCRMLVSFHGQKVYIRDDQYFSSAFPIPDSDQFILLTEIEDPFTLQEEWYEDADNHFVIMLFIMIGIVLGVLIYVPLVMINKRVRKLLKTQKAFGDGDLTARADSSRVSPMKEIADSFNYMADDIENRVKQAQIFSYAIPHEIRTPLTRIQMASDLLRRDDIEDKTVLFDQIDSYIEDISMLTADILKLAKLTNKSGEVSLATTEISLLELCQQRIDIIAESDTTLLMVEPGLQNPTCCVPEFYAKLVLDNLIKNANKYGNGKVEVAIGQSEDGYLIHVDDNGQGIPEDKKEEIFIAFSRLDKSRNLNQGGFGLGLAIAGQAAKNLNWKIEVTDSELGGARFTVLIPEEKQ